MVRFRPLLLLLVAALVVSACSVAEQLPLPRAQTQFATAEQAFNILIEHHVDKPTSQQLLNAAVDSVQTLLQKLNDPVPTDRKSVV